MKRIDETNPLGIDHVVERRLRKEADSCSVGDDPVDYVLELILARVHELRQAMIAAHDAVVNSLTLGGAKSTIAPYSERWRLSMDSIGRRLYPGTCVSVVVVVIVAAPFIVAVWYTRTHPQSLTLTLTLPPSLFFFPTIFFFFYFSTQASHLLETFF